MVACMVSPVKTAKVGPVVDDGGVKDWRAKEIFGTTRASHYIFTMEVIFDPSVVCDNQTGWGPTAAASVITTAPFMPFSKGDRSLGRIAEFGSSVHKYVRQQYNRGTY